LIKNIFGKQEELELFNKEGKLVYEFKNSNGYSRGFDIPEYTMEELVKKIENFKIKKLKINLVV
jgi:ABC-type proline/glycine betaine transport system substrate-binding protein